MIKKIKQFFNKNKEGYVSGLDFRPGIKALGMEEYKDTNIFYLSKPHKDNNLIYQPIYHFFYKKEFYSAEGASLDELKVLAHSKIDELK